MPEITIPASEVRKGGEVRTYSGIRCNHIEFETGMDDVRSIDDTITMHGGDKPFEFLLHMHKPHQNSNGIWYTITDDPPDAPLNRFGNPFRLEK